MANFKDFTFNKNEYNQLGEISSSEAIVLAIRNILLSRPGNFALTPSFGINLEKYMFELLDDETLNNLRTELASQIIRFLPELNAINVNIDKVKLESQPDREFLGIIISASLEGETIETRNLIYQSENGIEIINEY